MFIVNQAKGVNSKYFYHLTERIKMNTKSIRIFLVEDDLSFGSVLKSYLEINDYSVEWVDDGKYALDHFRRGTFNICILDIMLPHVDGFTIANEIRQINNEVPIIFLTAKKL